MSCLLLYFMIINFCHLILSCPQCLTVANKCLVSFETWIYKYVYVCNCLILILPICDDFKYYIKKAAKNVCFSGPATRASSLVNTFFSEFFCKLQKKFFFSKWPGRYPPPLLVAGPLKKYFFCGFPYYTKVTICKEHFNKIK